MTSNLVKRGFTFTHKHVLQPCWRPDIRKGEKYRDAPKAAMVVTSATKTTVYFTYADSMGRPLGRAAWYLSREKFEDTYLTVDELAFEHDEQMFGAQS